MKPKPESIGDLIRRRFAECKLLVAKANAKMVADAGGLEQIKADYERVKHKYELPEGACSECGHVPEDDEHHP